MSASANPPDLRPDRAPAARIAPAPRRRAGAPRIGMVSLGCPKALVDSERILTRLRAEGYEISPDYAGADAVIVNTCGFLDSARAESLEAIGEALKENGRVIVTGCLGAEPELITGAHPRVLAVTGPHQYEQVIDAVHAAVPPAPDPFLDLVPATGVRLTPRHYAYLKISEGCNHHCRFCIIPDLRGRLVSRPIEAVLREAERLVAAGTRELLVISQDTSAYGVDRRHAPGRWRDAEWRAHVTDLARGLGELGAWVRLHYVYPYPHVRELIPLMAEGRVLPYLDIPFQHAHPDTLRRMRRPAAAEKTLERLAEWRAICPDLVIRSTFIVGFPGETEAEFQTLLEWLEEARLDRVGCFKYENVAGAAANDLPDHVPEEVKEERWHRFMEVARRISAEKLAARVGRREQVIVDAVDEDGAICRTRGDAPEIDGNLFIDEGFEGLSPGDIVTVEVDEASEYDLWGRIGREEALGEEP
ncbi:MAG: 30S ribosomal protein S12 methylthiotransferase RimO [Alphaproteobacteria bacterium]|nr:MAG: 30S ribosomal protein S12 methylthiotransferase RimO [Alphaproteobacteria bacterium]